MATAPAPAPASPPCAAAAAHGDVGMARLAHLFRLSTRAGRVHPLQPLLQRHRAGEAA